MLRMWECVGQQQMHAVLFLPPLQLLASVFHPPELFNSTHDMKEKSSTDKMGKSQKVCCMKKAQTLRHRE